MYICVAGGQERRGEERGERRGERNGSSFPPALGSYISESRWQCRYS